MRPSVSFGGLISRIDCSGTNKVPIDKIEKLVREFFPLRPSEIIKTLNLRRPIFTKTAAYGHFGREDPDFTWEKTDRVAIIKKEIGLKK